MFYGGRLLSHLSADDELVSDFITLNRLNRNVAVVMDSDKASDAADVSGTKRRIAAGLKQNGEFDWITKGREIENYLDNEIYAKAMGEMSCVPNVGYEDPYSDRCVYLREDTATSVNKLKLAKTAMAISPKVDVLDLQARLGELAAFIRKASRKNI